LRFEGRKNIQNEQKSPSIIFLEVFGESEILDLEENQNFRIDEGHLVAYAESVVFKDDFNLKQLKTSILSNTDFVLLTGKGKVWLQSRKQMYILKEK
jgi:uncharacterized protein (AIM24 family)